MLTNFKIHGAYLTYPHANGFIDTDKLLLGAANGDVYDILCLDLDTGEVAHVARNISRLCTHGALWFDASLNNNTAYFVSKDGLGRLAYNGVEFKSSLLYALEEDDYMAELPSVKEDDELCCILLKSTAEIEQLYGFSPGNADGFELCRLPRAGLNPEAFPKSGQKWNHVHFVPYDSTWISFCNNYHSHRIGDRMWLWHAEHAPHGKCAFDQCLGTDEIQVFVGHECWAHHDFSAVTVAYMTSPNKSLPGVWEVFGDGREPRLLIPTHHAMHCNISRCGRYIVFDTFGPWDYHAPVTESWPDNISDIVVWDRESGKSMQVARSHVGKQSDNPPYFPVHPYHPHPCFHPSGNYIFFNDYDHNDECSIVCGVVNPFNQISSPMGEAMYESRS